MRVRLLALTVLAACVPQMPEDEGGPDGGLPPPPPPPPPPQLSLDYAGSYTLAETWDLSQPFGPDGLGGVVADVMIDQIVSLAGVPSPLEDEAHDLVAGALRQPLIDYVDSVVPADVASDSPTLAALDAIFSAVEVGGTLALSGGPSSLSGTETITAITVRHDGTAFAVSMAELLADSGAVTIAGDFAGGALSADTFSVGQHPLQLRYGKLVEIVARDALGIDTAAIAQAATAALECTALVDRITTAESYEITVQGQGFSAPATALEEACAALEAELVEAALGLVRRDAGIRLGGSARLVDADGNRAAETVTSQPGYGGAITALPGPVEPQVTASFNGSRQ